MRSARRRIIIGIACLAILCVAGVVLLGRKPPVVFTGLDYYQDVNIPDSDTIEVFGTCNQGGHGLWRYHIRADRWEKIPVRVVTIPYIDQMHFVRPVDPNWYAMDLGSITLCQPADESPWVDAWEPVLHETKRFTQVRLMDETQTVLGTVLNTPASFAWDTLPDHSGFWVLEERPTTRKAWVHRIIHSYSYQTSQWKIAYDCPWYCERQNPNTHYAGCQIIAQQHDWILIFANADYCDMAFQHRASAELWINLSTGAGHLGEPSLSPYQTRYSSDGRYCTMPGKIVIAQNWPQGAGMVGRTYSLAHQIGTLPSLPKYGEFGPEWSPDGHHVVFWSYVNNVRFESLFYERWTRWLERHSSLHFTHLQASGLEYHILDLAGNEIGRVPGANGLVGNDVLACADDASGYRHYFLVSLTGKVKKEIFRTKSP